MDPFDEFERIWQQMMEEVWETFQEDSFPTFTAHARKTDELAYSKELDHAQNLSEIFEIVKKIVRDFAGEERSGLMLGLAELGGRPGAFVGAFYPMGSNIIVLNKTPLRVVRNFKPEFYNSYCFHMLLHEYLHSLGVIDERYNRYLTASISEKAFGENHPVSVIAKDFNRVFPEIMYASVRWRPARNLEIEIVDNFDDENLRYIG